MVKLYSDNDLWMAMKQRRRLLAGFFIATAVYLAGVVALVTYYVLLTYQDPNETWVIVVTSVITGLYIIFCFPYMGISFKRCNNYCKMLKFISVGLKETAVLPFAGIEDWMTRDGVDVNVATFLVKNVKRDEDMIRQIYVDGEKDFPDFREGEYVRIVSQGNLLIAYELGAEGEERQK